MATVTTIRPQQITLDYEDFKGWLESFDPDSTVTTETVCPIRSYLLSKGAPERKTIVGLISYRVNDEECRFLPGWAKEFVGRIDSMLELEEEVYIGWHKATARQYLEVLEEVGG